MMMPIFVDKFVDFVYGTPKNFIKNVFKYRTILANDRWFDYYYFLEMMKTKLENDAKNYRIHGMTTVADEKAYEMEYAVKVLDRIINDDYIENWNKDHDEKWGKTNLEFLDDGCLELSRPNVITEEDKDQEREEFIANMWEADRQKKGDIKGVFSFISDHLLGWWD